MVRARRGHEVLGVAREVHPAALPGGPEQLLADRGHEPGVGIADDEPDTGQAALDERADEAGPGATLAVAGASSSPSTRRSPVAATPMATSAAMLVTRPASRTLT